ncbi:MAG: hypothetical protein JW871_02340 [Endomicrobiales bacterium]|nr:hypothetical protein [Endomicrobiales bacterium]
MPRVKVIVRKKKKRFFQPIVPEQIKIAIVIILLSILLGKIALLVSDSLSKYSALPLETSIDKYKNNIIKKYKEKHGSEWKKKLKEDYKAHSK